MIFMQTRSLRTAAIAVCVAAWLTGASAGVHTLMLYAYTPAPTAPVVVAQWPASLAAQAPARRPLLVMFIHPQCACSRASLSELAVIATQIHQAAEIRVYVARPTGTPDGWEQTDLLRDAARIPGATVVVDRDGAISRSLDATVSGETLLFTADGRRVFHGGLTPARGHEGNSDGRRAVLSLIANSTSAPVETPVFGCFLRASVAD